MDYMSAYKAWCENPALNEEGKAELASVASDPEKIEYRFGAELEFGTAGMRGIIGYGTNMMNVYTVRRATQGLAEYVKSLGAPAANLPSSPAPPRKFWRRTASPLTCSTKCTPSPCSPTPCAGWAPSPAS